MILYTTLSNGRGIFSTDLINSLLKCCGLRCQEVAVEYFGVLDENFMQLLKLLDVAYSIVPGYLLKVINIPVATLGIIAI